MAQSTDWVQANTFTGLTAPLPDLTEAFRYLEWLPVAKHVMGCTRKLVRERLHRDDWHALSFLAFIEASRRRAVTQRDGGCLDEDPCEIPIAVLGVALPFLFWAAWFGFREGGKLDMASQSYSLCGVVCHIRSPEIARIGVEHRRPVIGASFLLVTDVVNNEAGLPFPVTGYGAGYWLWLASMFSACVAALISPRQRVGLAWPSR